MKHYFILLCFFALLNVNCSGSKGTFLRSEKTICDDAIHNCILDFKKTKLFKKGKFFVIFCDSIDADLIEISIMEDYESKFIYSASAKMTEHKLPNNLFEINNKLFAWWSDDQVVDEKVFNLLQQYNMLKDDEGGWLKYGDSTIDDLKEVASYYICRKDFRFQRIISNKDIKPNIKCD